MITTKHIQLLERVRDMLGVEQSGPGTQAKPSQNNRSSTAAAKTKLKELEGKLTKGRTADTKVQAHGSKR